MNRAKIDVAALLAEIRGLAVEQAARAWPQLGALVDGALSLPLGPFALLPVCTGIACGASLDLLKPAAACVSLAALALRIVDDCADGDNPHALYVDNGLGRTVNAAAALSMVALQELTQLPFPVPQTPHSPPQSYPVLPMSVGDAYLQAFLQVCAGQDGDLRAEVQTLEEYCALVEAKTVAAYRFAAWLGGRCAGSEESVLLRAATCGMHLGWMMQMLDDIEALWFPGGPSDLALGRLTFPPLYGLTMSHGTVDHTAVDELAALCQAPPFAEARIRQLLDEMGVRPLLMSHALDHRDAALASLASPLLPLGRDLLQHWLNWVLRDGERLLGS